MACPSSPTTCWSPSKAPTAFLSTKFSGAYWWTFFAPTPCPYCGSPIKSLSSIFAITRCEEKVEVVAGLSLHPYSLDLAPLCHPLSTTTLLSVSPIAPCLTPFLLCDDLPQFVIVLNFTSLHLNTIQHLSSPVLLFINKFDFPVIGLVDLALELMTQPIGRLVLFTNDVNFARFDGTIRVYCVTIP